MGEQREGKHSKNKNFTIFIGLIIMGYEINLKVAVDLFINKSILS